jgi:pyruvate kinase
LLLNDGLLKLTVDSVRDEEVRTTVVSGGDLSNNKGINKAGAALTAPALTAKDMDDIKTAMSFQCEYLAVSFPKSATDMEMARQLANVAGEPWRHKPQLIAKIERSEAIPGTRADPEGVGRDHGRARRSGRRGRQRDRAGAAEADDPAGREMDRFVITATQMMESMIVNPVPTARRGQRRRQRGSGRHRCGDAERRDRGGTLSGRDGRDHVDDLRRVGAGRGDLARRRLHEQDLRPHRPVDRDGGAVHGYHLGCKAILALTESGSTALWMSRHKIHVPIFGLTSQVRTQRRMSIYRNVRPMLMPSFADRDEALAQAELLLVQGGVLKPGDTYAITCGEPMGYPGGTNMLKVGRVGG